MKILLTAVVSLLLAASCAAGATTSRSGLRGTALIHPSEPVCKPGTSCSRPAPHALLAFWRDGREVAHTRTDGKGRYRVSLPPRHSYTVTSSMGTMVTPARVKVASDRYRRVTFRLDTGIR
jgi:hypothetical protein